MLLNKKANFDGRTEFTDIFVKIPITDLRKSHACQRLGEGTKMKVFSYSVSVSLKPKSNVLTLL